VLRRRSVHRHARPLREARGHDQGIQDDRERRARRSARAGVLHEGPDRGSNRSRREAGGGEPVGAAMATAFHLAILTPERSVFDGAVEYVQVPGSEGYLGVLAHHAGLVTSLGAGTLTVRRLGGAEETLSVSGGFFEVGNNRATVLADSVSGELRG